MPLEQEQLIKMQMVTHKIYCIIHTEDRENRVEVTLKTDDPQAAQLLPQLPESIVATVAQLLYQLFAITGERV